MDWIDINERKPENDTKILAFYPEDKSISTWIWFSGDTGISHWMPIKFPLSKKVRWKVPSEGSEYYFIDIYGEVKRRVWDNDDPTFYRKFLGVYPTEKEAIQMAQKIRRFVISQIGEID